MDVHYCMYHQLAAITLTQLTISTSATSTEVFLSVFILLITPYLTGLPNCTKDPISNLCEICRANVEIKTHIT